REPSRGPAGWAAARPGRELRRRPIRHQLARPRRLRGLDYAAHVPPDRSLGRVTGEGEGMTTPEILPPTEKQERKLTPLGRIQTARSGAQGWWRRTSSSISDRWRSLPRGGRIIAIFLFLAFLCLRAAPRVS